jgi:Skp family chaperone for outer membrane proteins
VLLPCTALAEVKIAVVDFQDALSRINEGTTAMAHLEGVRDEKARAMEKKRQELAAMQTEIRNQSSILSEAALTAKQEAFLQAQAEFQQAAMQAEQELQESYMAMMEEFFGKLSAVAEQIGKEKGYNLILESNESGVVYVSGVDDITDDLVTRYNAQHPAK